MRKLIVKIDEVNADLTFFNGFLLGIGAMVPFNEFSYFFSDDEIMVHARPAVLSRVKTFFSDYFRDDEMKESEV